jgi:hypothetical protein
MPVTIHGSVLDGGRTGSPQAVQKRAPGTRTASQARHFASVRGAPQDGQKLPSDSVPHEGHFMAGS